LAASAATGLVTGEPENHRGTKDEVRGVGEPTGLGRFNITILLGGYFGYAYACM